RHRERSCGDDRGARPRPLRPAPGRDPPRPRPAPADLREDRRIRALRPRRRRVHVGEDRQGRRVAHGCWSRYGRGYAGLVTTLWHRARVAGTRCPRHAAASSVAPIALLSRLPASLHRTRPSRPVGAWSQPEGLTNSPAAAFSEIARSPTFSIATVN